MTDPTTGKKPGLPKWFWANALLILVVCLLVMVNAVLTIVRWLT